MKLEIRVRRARELRQQFGRQVEPLDGMGIRAGDPIGQEGRTEFRRHFRRSDREVAGGLAGQHIRQPADDAPARRHGGLLDRAAAHRL